MWFVDEQKDPSHVIMLHRCSALIIIQSACSIHSMNSPRETDLGTELGEEGTFTSLYKSSRETSLKTKTSLQTVVPN